MANSQITNPILRDWIKIVMRPTHIAEISYVSLSIQGQIMSGGMK